MKSIIALLLALACCTSFAAEVVLIETKGGPLMLDDTTIAVRERIVVAKGYIVVNGDRVPYFYAVEGCARGYGIIMYSQQDGAYKEQFYWTREGEKGGDVMARTICVRAP